MSISADSLDSKSPAQPTTAELPERYADVETYHDALERLTEEAIVAYHESRNFLARFVKLKPSPGLICDAISNWEERAKEHLVRAILTANTADLEHGDPGDEPKPDPERTFEAHAAAAVLSHGRLYIAAPIEKEDLDRGAVDKTPLVDRCRVIILDLNRIAKVGFDR